MSYWAIGIPVGLICAFKFDLGVKGLWIGTTSAVTFQMFAYLMVLKTTNWQVAADEA